MTNRSLDLSRAAKGIDNVLSDLKAESERRVARA
jgi:hypothetical protein